MKKRMLFLLSILCIAAMMTGILLPAALAEGTVSKVILIEWRDENNIDGLRKDSVSVTLSNGQSVTLTKANNWTQLVEGLEPGTVLTAAEAIEGYIPTFPAAERQGDVIAVTYTHTVSRTSVSVSAKWADGDNTNGVRPESVKVRLMADGAPQGAEVTLNRGNSWQNGWTDLPVAAGGKTVNYTVAPVSVPEFYTASVEGTTVTYTLGTGSLTIRNSVSGAPAGANTGSISMTVSGPDSRMPMTLTLAQMAGGSYTLENLLPGAYLVQETNADDLAAGYILDAGKSRTGDAAYIQAGESVTLTLANVYTDVIPDASENTDPTAGYGALTFEIIGPDPRMPITLSYSQFTGGRYELTDLVPGSYVVIERNAGTLVASYVLQSDSVTGMSLTVEGNGRATARLFNHYAPAPTPAPGTETVDIPVTKIWNDNGNRDGNRPSTVTVYLFADGAEVDRHELSEAEGWHFVFTGKPRFNGQQEIVYSVNEAPVKWYMPSINGTTITNNYQPELTSVAVQKIWDDNNNAAGRRPASVTVTLSNGQSYILNDENGWSVTVNDLPTMVNGEPVTYAWREQEAMGYVLSSVQQDGNTMIFTNKIWERPEVPEGQEKPKVPGTTWYVFEEYDTPLGVEVMINHVGDCFD